jgi:hypothetical protein
MTPHHNAMQEALALLSLQHSNYVHTAVPDTLHVRTVSQCASEMLY